MKTIGNNNKQQPTTTKSINRLLKSNHQIDLNYPFFHSPLFWSIWFCLFFLFSCVSTTRNIHNSHTDKNANNQHSQHVANHCTCTYCFKNNVRIILAFIVMNIPSYSKDDISYVCDFTFISPEKHFLHQIFHFLVASCAHFQTFHVWLMCIEPYTMDSKRHLKCLQNCDNYNISFIICHRKFNTRTYSD